MTQSNSTPHELPEDDLQRSPEQDVDQHRDTSARLQEAVAEVFLSHRESSLDSAIDALNDAIARRDHPPQPEPWVEAVAMDVIAGRLYVINEQALADAGVEVPALDLIKQSSGRDRGSDPA